MSVPISPTLDSPVPTETNLQKEQKLFGELFRRLVNAVINNIFDLRPIRAVQRMQYLVFLFCLSILLITFTHQDYTLFNWAQHLRNLFLYIFNSNFRVNYPSNAINDFIYFVRDAFLDPHTLQYIPIFLAPFFIGLQSAAIYLADIFELEDVAIARKFIWEVALSGSNQVIRVKEGEVSDEYRQTPMFLIGGPGKVVVDLDSAALFEKPDGTPHIIGPTGREPGGRATLDGFERFRQAIDIRDHYVDLRDQDPRSQSVKSRSRDGLPITATDVRLMFSVYRGENPKRTNQFPYPFNPEAIERIVYKASSRVTPDQPNPSAFEFSWVNNMVGLIRGRLGAFMGERKLSDYLASIGVPEFEKAKQNEEKIAAQIRELTQQTDANLQQNEIKPPPIFTPRYKITNLFSEFAEDFTRSARNSGVELHWIGVGTWKTPVEIVPEKHLEAWKITQENLRNGSDEVLKKSENEAMLHKTASLIRSVPLESYEQISGMGRSSMRRRPGPGLSARRDIIKKEPETSTDLTIAEPGLSNDSMDADVLSSLMIMQAFQGGRRSYSSDYYDLDHESAMKMLLLEYRKQLIEAVEFMKARNETVPPKIEEAINHINDQSGWQHWVGR
jgi:hypothetical protein